MRPGARSRRRTGASACTAYVRCVCFCDSCAWSRLLYRIVYLQRVALSWRTGAWCAVSPASFERQRSNMATPTLPPVTPQQFPGYMLATASSTQSMFGPQVKSQRPSSSAYSFHRMGTGRERHAKSFDGAVVDPLYRGDEWNRHTIPATPIPGTYSHAVSIGRQALSQRRLAPSFGFGKAGRWAHLDRAEKVRRTPGPGEYVA